MAGGQGRRFRHAARQLLVLDTTALINFRGDGLFAMVGSVTGCDLVTTAYRQDPPLVRWRLRSLMAVWVPREFQGLSVRLCDEKGLVDQRGGLY